MKLGGFKDYRNWDRSTFFEFDPNPYRSTRFFVTRAIDDPFKARDPDRHRNDPDQLLMMFHIQRGGVGRSCINCGERKMAQNEVVSAGPEMSSEEPVWLPPGRFYSAPHIAADGEPCLRMTRSWQRLRPGCRGRNCLWVGSRAEAAR